MLALALAAAASSSPAAACSLLLLLPVLAFPLYFCCSVRLLLYLSAAHTTSVVAVASAAWAYCYNFLSAFRKWIAKQKYTHTHTHWSQTPAQHLMLVYFLCPCQRYYYFATKFVNQIRRFFRNLKYKLLIRIFSRVKIASCYCRNSANQANIPYSCHIYYRT